MSRFLMFTQKVLNQNTVAVTGVALGTLAVVSYIKGSDNVNNSGNSHAVSDNRTSVIESYFTSSNKFGKK